jgi:Gpi18-like mannosyltransferase
MKKPLIILILIFVGTILYFFPKFTVDDSAILFRYADNFKETGSLVWNTGEYLESYTGLVLLLFLIVSPLPYILTVHIVGVISFLIGGYILYLLLKDSIVKEVILFCYLFSPTIYVHVYSGLETVLFTTLTLASIYFWKEQRKYCLLVSLVVLTLTRPEGIILSILLLINQRGDK